MCCFVPESAFAKVATSHCALPAFLLKHSANWPTPHLVFGALTDTIFNNPNALVSDAALGQLVQNVHLDKTTLLLLAVCNGNVTIVQQLVRQNVSVVYHYKDKMNEQIAIEIAAKRGDAAMVRALLAHPATNPDKALRVRTPNTVLFFLRCCFLLVLSPCL